MKLTLTALTAALILTGCGPDTPAPTQTSKPIPKPPAAIPAKQAKPVPQPKPAAAPVTKAASDKLLAKIQNTDDIFELHELNKQLKDSPDGTPSVMAALTGKYDQALAALESKPFSDALSLLACEYEQLEQGKHILSLLLQVSAKIDGDYAVGVIAKVDERHESLMPESYKQYKHLEAWLWPPTIQTSSWEPGRAVLLTKVMEVPPVPLNLTITVQHHKTRENIGEDVQVGWVGSIKK